MRTSVEQRKLMAKLVRVGNPINLVAKWFGVDRRTVSFWSKQDLRTVKDLPRNTVGKISLEIEIAIISMRLTFKWGTARIQQGLINLPEFMINELEVQVQNFHLSRTAINNVLKKHNLNGYSRRKTKSWKFFRAKKPDELWQVDLKEFKFEGKKYYIFVVVDDYSRFILSLNLFDHCPTTNDLTSSLKNLKVKPEKILADNGSQFREQWKKFLDEKMKVEPIFAHPYYPQDKGKVERCIRNLAEEFVNLLSRFRHWINGKMEEWRVWFNEKRFHRGIKDCPSNLYVQLGS